MSEKKMTIKEYKDYVEKFLSNVYKGVCEECSDLRYAIGDFRADVKDEYFRTDYVEDEDGKEAFLQACYRKTDAIYDTYERLDEVSDSAMRLANMVWNTRLSHNDQLIYRFAMLNVVDQCNRMRDTLMKWYKEVVEVVDREFHIEIPFGDSEGVWVH